MDTASKGAPPTDSLWQLVRYVLRPGTLGFALIPFAAAAGMELISTLPMPGVKGRIDHLSVDVKGHRLFVAALGNDTVEVLDTKDGRRRTLTGMSEPQGVLYVAQSERLFVANGRAGRVDIVDATSLETLKRLEGMPDADNLRFDAAARQVVVGYGHGALRFLDPATGERSGEVKLPGHPESFQLEQTGARAFVNVPSSHAVMAVDRRGGGTAGRWALPLAAWANYPMALDEGGQRLFVGARKPAVMVVYDTASGNVVADMPIGGDTDDIFFDAKRKRVYLVCGEGRIDVIRQVSSDRYVAEPSIATAPRARTGLFVPEEDRLYVAAPAQGASPARMLVFHVQ